MSSATAASLAAAAVAEVRDDPAGRLALMRRLYERPQDNDPLPSPSGDHAPRRLPYRRAATAFMQWQLRRGVLAPAGSPWWRAVNEDLIRVTAEARYLAAGTRGEPSTPAVRQGLEFIADPTTRRWYLAHNTAIATAYLDHRHLAAQEGRVERFFLNLVLLRVLYAHALVAEPRLALGWLAPISPVLGDPRLGITGIFLSLSRVLPNSYPLGEDVTPYVADEHGFGRLLDAGVIQPRLRALYDWSADELHLPGLTDLLVDDIPVYAWDPGDRHDWNPPLTAPVRFARRAVPLRPA